MDGPRGWIAEAGRANLGFDDPSPYAHLDAEDRRRVASSLRWMLIIWVALSVVAGPVAWLITRDSAALTAALVTAAFSDLVFIWIYLSYRRDLRELIAADERATWPPPVVREPLA